MNRIKCIICNKNLILLRYSHNQLKKYKENIHFSNELKAERPRCLTCTAIPGQELKCIHCGLHKSLEAFSKNARSKDRDRAVRNSPLIFGDLAKSSPALQRVPAKSVGPRGQRSRRYEGGSNRRRLSPHRHFCKSGF